MFEPVIMSFFIAALGACLGSFANVAALRTLAGQDWIRQPSACFACHKPLSMAENLPIFGYLRRAGRCQCAEQHLPVRYLLVELVMAMVLLLGYWRLGGLQLVFFTPFIVLLLVIFLTDMQDFMIPDWASLGGLTLGLVLAFVGTPGLPAAQTALLGASIGFSLIWGINFLYRLWRGRDGMGFGDVKLMAMLGAWLGPVSLLPILFAASLAGAVFGIIMICVSRQQNDAPAQLPFGCFLVPAACFWLLFAADFLRAQ